MSLRRRGTAGVAKYIQETANISSRFRNFCLWFVEEKEWGHEHGKREGEKKLKKGMEERRKGSGKAERWRNTYKVRLMLTVDRNICSVPKMWYFWKHAVVGQCFYTTLLVIKLLKCPGLTKYTSTARTTDNYVHLIFDPAIFMHAVSEYRTLLFRHCLNLTTEGFV